MFVYLYDEYTKEYIGSKLADIDPLETEKAGYNVYLLPYNATFFEAPARDEGQAVIFNGEQWQVVTDNRGKYTIKDGSFQEIQTLDPVERVLTDKEFEGLKDGSLIIKDGEIIAKPAPTRLEIEEIRRSLYIAHKDPLTCQIESLKDEEQTPEIVAEIEALKVKRANVVLDIKTKNPSPEEA